MSDAETYPGAPQVDARGPLHGKIYIDNSPVIYLFIYSDNNTVIY